jgi:hypothetical protein
MVRFFPGDIAAVDPVSCSAVLSLIKQIERTSDVKSSG